MNDEKLVTSNRRRFLKDSAVAVGTLTLGSSLAACGSGDGKATRAGGKTTTLRYVVHEPPTSANFDDFAVLGGTDVLVASLVQDRLFEFDKNGRVVPRLATGMRQVNPLTVEVALRDGVTFHNGENFTAEDVKLAIDRVSRNEKLALNSLWASAETKILSTNRVRIKTDAPFAPLINTLAVTSIPPGSFTKDPSKFEGNDVGAGPYKFVEYRRNRVVLEANAKYWDGKPPIDRIVLEYVSDADARLNALLAGEAHIVRDAAPEQWKATKDKKDFYAVPGWKHGGLVVLYQHNDKAIAQKAVRQAMIHAVDRETMMKQLWGDEYVARFAKVSDSILPSGTAFYQPLSKQFRFDPETAKRLLESSGVADVKLTFASATLAPVQSEISQRIVEYLSDVGIEAEITTLEVGKYRTDYAKYDLDVNGLGTFNGDPDAIFKLYTGPLSQAVLHLQDNPESKDFVRLQDAQRKVVDARERQVAVTAAAEWLWDFQPIMPLTDAALPRLVSSRVKNFSSNGTLGDPLLRKATLN